MFKKIRAFFLNLFFSFVLLKWYPFEEIKNHNAKYLDMYIHFYFPPRLPLLDF